MQTRHSVVRSCQIIFFHCNVGQGTEGTAFVQQLAQLTGADIAASDDLTGQGGDWQFEVTVGEIDTASMIDSATQAAYDGTLATYNGKEYFLTSGRKTWQQAEAEAQNRGGHLVTINNAAEEIWLRNTFSKTEGLWIGINDQQQEGNFQWANGESVTYTNWAPGEPNNWGSGQDYGWINYGNTRQWDDNSATAQLRGIIEIGGSTGGTGSIALEKGALSVDESIGTAKVDVVRQQGSSGTVTVDYQTVNGSAKAGSDYASRSGTLTFSPGQTRKTISVPVTNDTLDEGTEDFAITIDNVPGGASLLAPLWLALL